MSNFENAIKAAPEAKCLRCDHRIGLDDIGYCELWECDFKPIEKNNSAGGNNENR